MREFPTYHAADVERLLDYPGCIATMRATMSALSTTGRDHPLRTMVPVGPGRTFAQMPGLAAEGADFGAKLVSVFRDPDNPGHAAHRGVVVLFDGDTGSVRCVADGAAITHIRTACATAAATDTLARADARTLAIFGTGAQAESHIRALLLVRPFERVLLWGRSLDAAAALADRIGAIVEPVGSPIEAAESADVICTVTASAFPILRSGWVRPGTHVNAVGSSAAGPVEVDGALVVRSRYFVEYRPSALAAAAELIAAIDAGLVGPDHILAEIGEVMLGQAPGRVGPSDVTLYKSLGHVVQDLAATAYVHQRAVRDH